jgi:hypothetical protein
VLGLKQVEQISSINQEITINYGQESKGVGVMGNGDAPNQSVSAAEKAAAKTAPVVQPAASPCIVTRVVVAGQPNTYNATPGTIKLKIVPGIGIIQFDVLNCSVSDNAGTAVPFTASSPIALSFPVVAGKTYTLQAGYVVNQNATANLVEDCVGQTHIADLFAVQAIAGASYAFTVN